MIAALYIVAGASTVAALALVVLASVAWTFRKPLRLYLRAEARATDAALERHRLDREGVRALTQTLRRSIDQEEALYTQQARTRDLDGRAQAEESARRSPSYRPRHAQPQAEPRPAPKRTRAASRSQTNGAAAPGAG